eukprot:10236279-Lingulodinium_polyedra.AAC.1
MPLSHCGWRENDAVRHRKGGLVSTMEAMEAVDAAIAARKHAQQSPTTPHWCLAQGGARAPRLSWRHVQLPRLGR